MLRNFSKFSRKTRNSRSTFTSLRISLSSQFSMMQRVKFYLYHPLLTLMEQKFQLRPRTFLLRWLELIFTNRGVPSCLSWSILLSLPRRYSVHNWISRNHPWGNRKNWSIPQLTFSSVWSWSQFHQYNSRSFLRHRKDPWMCRENGSSLQGCQRR